MAKKEEIKFNLTSDMVENIARIFRLKNELNDIESILKNTNDLELEKRSNELKKELDNYKKNFIREFKENNKEQILEYTQINNINK